MNLWYHKIKLEISQNQTEFITSQTWFVLSLNAHTIALTAVWFNEVSRLNNLFNGLVFYTNTPKILHPSVVN